MLKNMKINISLYSNPFYEYKYGFHFVRVYWLNNVQYLATDVKPTERTT